MLVSLVAAAESAADDVRFVVRAQTGHNDVRHYGSHTNDGSAYRSRIVFASGGTASSKGDRHIGEHDYSGGQFTDALLSDGSVASLVSASSDDCVVWNPANGRPLFTNNLGGSSLSFRHIAPLPPLPDMEGVELRSGSLAAFRSTSWGAFVAVFAREGPSFVLPGSSSRGRLLCEGLASGADYWGAELGNVYLREPGPTARSCWVTGNAPCFCTIRIPARRRCAVCGGVDLAAGAGACRPARLPWWAPTARCASTAPLHGSGGSRAREVLHALDCPPRTDVVADATAFRTDRWAF